MLDLITKSAVRKKILKLLFANENKEYYLSQIARVVKTSVGTCQRELEKMAKSGIISSKKQANLVYYFINKQNPLLKDLRNIINKTIGIDKDLKEIMRKIKGIKYAFIFGSYAKGDFSADSDMDVVIIGNPSEDNLLTEINKLENNIEREINYHLYSESDFKTKLKTSSFLSNIIQNNLFLTNNQNEFRRWFKQSN